MSRKTILRMQAVTDEDEIFGYLLQQSPGLAKRFSDAYLATLKRIIAKPKMATGISFPSHPMPACDTVE